MPVRVKIPPPMMAPMPKEVNPQRVSTRFKSLFLESARYAEIGFFLQMDWFAIDMY
jgi:hypothetical protein